jgi:ABC-type dipeptide/oligopeptide/nickel transport system permease subunit
MMSASSEKYPSLLGSLLGSKWAPRRTATKANTRARRWHLVPTLPIVMLVAIVTTGALGPVLTPYDPIRNDLAASLRPPAWVSGGSLAHVLGTDSFGRDVLTRLIYGARVSLLVVLFSLIIAVCLGAGIGLIAGYLGGRVDAILMRWVDIMLAMPPLLVALVVAVAFGPSFRNLVLIIGFLMWPDVARMIRGETLVVRRQDFVNYSKAIGLPMRAILLRQILPNVLPTLLVAATLMVANVILTEASLSFLGAGLPPPTASWGVMVEDGRALIATGWWIALFPGLAIVVTVLSFNSLGDWLRDRLDPHTREY